MPFANALKESLLTRQSEVPVELANGDGLERVLTKYLLAVEAMADRELLTSILVLDSDGRRLRHGAAPNLPPDFCRAIDGGEIGPRAGSCGTAVHLNRPVYVTDIATDPLWADYRDLALPHGLRSCWSTPIRDSAGAVIGSFAIYHRSVGSPTPDEIEAIELITDHVAQAITCARDSLDSGRSEPEVAHRKAALGLVGGATVHQKLESFDDLSRLVYRLQAHVDELDRAAMEQRSGEAAEALKVAADDCRRLIDNILSRIQTSSGPDSHKH